MLTPFSIEKTLAVTSVFVIFYDDFVFISRTSLNINSCHFFLPFSALEFSLVSSADLNLDFMLVPQGIHPY